LSRGYLRALRAVAAEFSAVVLEEVLKLGAKLEAAPTVLYVPWKCEGLYLPTTGENSAVVNLSALGRYSQKERKVRESDRVRERDVPRGRLRGEGRG